MMPRRQPPQDKSDPQRSRSQANPNVPGLANWLKQSTRGGASYMSSPILHLLLAMMLCQPPGDPRQVLCCLGPVLQVLTQPGVRGGGDGMPGAAT
jgi:hypothetical protein